MLPPSLPSRSGAPAAPRYWCHEADRSPVSLLDHALRAGHAPPPHRRAVGARVLVIGASGTLGSAVLEHLLGGRAFTDVAVVVTRPVGVALSGLRTVVWPAPIGASALAEPVPRFDTGVVVFDRERHANGREQPFLRPDPEGLAALAASLRNTGVRHLVVVLPHAPSSLPEALKHGLANLDEQAVAALGFEHLVFVRSAQAGPSTRANRAGQRVADWMLSQLRLMVPARAQPVRVQKVGEFAARLAAHLPEGVTGARVVAPEALWEAAQADDLGAWVRDWVRGRPPAERGAPIPRL